VRLRGRPNAGLEASPTLADETRRDPGSPHYMESVLINFAEIFGILLILRYLARPLQKLKIAWWHWARRRVTCIVLAGLIPVLLHLAFYPRPEPAVADEFAYLLQADTFVHGRLANPVRPLWEHFEQFHVISQPVFAAKYQPLPAAFLAVGQELGSPYYGVLIGAALTFSAALWMLYGWLPPSYALVGWVIALVTWGPSTYWMNSYWGGLVPALGGILVTGAWPRLRKAVSLRDSSLLGLGIVMLAASRPYEGLVLCTLSCGSLLWVQPQNWRWILKAAPVVAGGLGVLMYYNFKVAGSPWVLPYFVHDGQYAAIGNFIFQHPKAILPVYRHPEFRRLFADLFVEDSADYRAHPLSKLSFVWGFYFKNWPLMLALVCGPFAVKNRRLRWAAILLALFFAGLCLLTGILPHYAAPAVGLLLVFQVGGLHWLRYWNPQGKPLGSLLARVAILAMGLLFLQDVIQRPFSYTSGPAPFKALRKSLLAQLDAAPGKQLVMVRYSAEHSPHMDFVVNGADFDHARILWARAMGAEADRSLIDYFRDRRIWTMDGDDPHPQLKCQVNCADVGPAALSHVTN